LGDVGAVVAVTGTKREGAALRGLDVTVIAGGGAPERLAAELAAPAEGAAGIVSFGMAGALDPSLRLGAWVVGERVLGDFEAVCDADWAKALATRLPRARIGAVHAADRLIASPADKAELFRTGAIATDMESHLAAQAAAQAGVPFAILRCISDEARTRLPPAIAVAMKPGGGLALAAVLGSIIGQPGQLPALIRAAAGFNRAFQALKAGANAAGQRLAFDQCAAQGPSPRRRGGPLSD
jgi:hopanoid-associated phosphorylase